MYIPATADTVIPKTLLIVMAVGNVVIFILIFSNDTAYKSKWGIQINDL